MKIFPFPTKGNILINNEIEISFKHNWFKFLFVCKKIYFFNKKIKKQYKKLILSIQSPQIIEIYNYVDELYN